MDIQRLRSAKSIDSDEAIGQTGNRSSSDRSDQTESSNRSVDIKPFLKRLRELERRDPIRREKVRRISLLIEEGKYETPERIEELAENLLDELL